MKNFKNSFCPGIIVEKSRVLFFFNLNFETSENDDKSLTKKIFFKLKKKLNRNS